MGDNGTVDEILEFWFGRVEETIVPSEERARVWFGDSLEVDAEVKSQFSSALQEAIDGKCSAWEETPRGRLALIIMLDQFSRHIYRDTSNAFAQDDYALGICARGMENRQDHELSLIERVFYYFPLLHSEDLVNQERSVHAYQQLVELAFPETQVIYERFLEFATHHYRIIRQFARFPQRNVILGRESTDDEIKYLKEIQRFRG